MPEPSTWNSRRFSHIDDLIADAGDFDGFISIGPSVLSSDRLLKLHLVLPYGVFIDINPAPSLFDSVQPDLGQTILEALDVLMASGKRRIGYIGGAGSRWACTNTPKTAV